VNCAEITFITPHNDWLNTSRADETVDEYTAKKIANATSGSDALHIEVFVSRTEPAASRPAGRLAEDEIKPVVFPPSDRDNSAEHTENMNEYHIRQHRTATKVRVYPRTWKGKLPAMRVGVLDADTHTLIPESMVKARRCMTGDSSAHRDSSFSRKLPGNGNRYTFDDVYSNLNQPPGYNATFYANHENLAPRTHIESEDSDF
jgi:hypothetical protein